MGVSGYALRAVQRTQYFPAADEYSFEREINSVILVYLDDILIYSRSMEEHWEHLRHALDKLH